MKILNNIQGWVFNGPYGNDLMADTDHGLTLNANVYGGKEFQVYIGADASVGAQHATANGAGMQRLDVEGVTLPTFSPNQEFEMRTGAGRVAEFSQVFSSSKRVVNEISLSGRVSTNDLPIFMENIFAQAATANNNLFEIPYNYAPTPFEFEGTTGATVYNKSLSIYFEAPTAADSYLIPGCVCTSLTISGDMGTASGRFNYDATFQSGSLPLKAAKSMTLATAIGNTNLYLSELSTRDMDIMDISGATTGHTSIKPLFNNLSLTIEAPSQFLGAQGANAEPEVYARAVPELTVTVGGGIKYDDETDNLLEAYRDTGNISYIRFTLNNRATNQALAVLGTDTIDAHEDQLFGLIVPKAKLTSCEISSDDVAMVNFECKVLAPASEHFLHVATGPTA